MGYRIHKEGFAAIIFSGTLLIIFNIGVSVFFQGGVFFYGFAVLSLLFWLLLMRFFRVPVRKLKTEKHTIYAPADGKVVAVEQTIENEFFKEKMTQISIFMSVWDVHQNLSPITGRLVYYKYHPGKYLLAKNPKSSDENERTSIVLEDKSGHRIMLRQIAGAVARRIVCKAEEKTVFGQNTEIGFIKFGSRVDIFLPVDFPLKIKIGDKTKAGITPLAEKV